MHLPCPVSCCHENGRWCCCYLRHWLIMTAMSARAAHSLVARLWAGRSGVLFLTGERNFSLIQNTQTTFGTHQISSCAMGTVDLFPGKGGKAMMPTAHPPLKPKFRMNGPVPPFPVYTFMACRDTTLPLLQLTALHQEPTLYLYYSHKLFMSHGPSLAFITYFIQLKRQPLSDSLQVSCHPTVTFHTTQVPSLCPE